MVLGFLDQLQIFWQLYLIELLGLLTGLGLHELWHLIYPRFLTGFGMLVFFTNLILMEFQVRYLALFLLFSVIDDFEWFWMESLHKNIQLMLEFLKAPFLVLHFSCYILMTFLMMLSVILLSMLMILLFTLSVIRHLICGSNEIKTGIPSIKIPCNIALWNHYFDCHCILTVMIYTWNDDTGYMMSKVILNKEK